MATKTQSLADLKAAAEAAKKAFEDALEAGRQEAINNIHTIIAENSLPISALVSNKAQAIAVAQEITATFRLKTSDVFKSDEPSNGEAPAGSNAASAETGKKQAAPLQKGDVAILWPAALKTVPADVQGLLDLWKQKKPFSEFIAYEKKEQRLGLIVRVEKASGHKATKEQLADLGYTREEIDAKAKRMEKNAADQKAKKAA
ncbi:hypothetical protein LFL96_25690 [Paraburkholderia sp. D15]|uniref:hypothetical protein n=1 Tax=Paraburkholderia sp. D15 TaxID=2880218 RepID=UPI00247ADD20|nr:hypothetical protein [Paraburkholderia sp. D15]WGS54408.1 hypothetical protein LFL96_25690 [Paraburkholderia sp. D15]